MQDDEITGPAVLTLLDGEALWGKLGCQGCHQDAATSMKGVAARYPAMVDGKLDHARAAGAAQGASARATRAVICSR